MPQAPVVVRICTVCGLAQLDRVPSPDPGVAASPKLQAALARPVHGHGRRRPGAMADHLAGWSADVLALTRLRPGGLVVDMASGDGALLDPFLAAGMAVLGCETRPELVAAAHAAGIATIPEEFGSPASVERIAAAGGAQLVLVNHALAHVEDADAAAAALRGSVASDGWAAIEFLDLLSIVARGEFDVFGHAHRSYFSLTAMERLLARHGLAVVAARRTPVHGGGLQIVARRADRHVRRRRSVDRILARETAARLDDPRTLGGLGDRAQQAACRLRRYLEAMAASGRSVAGYGAPGRAVALLALAGVDGELLPFTVDRDPTKVGLSLPGSGIEIRGVQALDEHRPDEVLVLAWTWVAEVARELGRLDAWRTPLVVPLPRLRTVRIESVVAP